MKNGLSSEFMFQLFALLTAIILVHAMYVAVIRPSADAQLAAEMAAQLAGEEVVPQAQYHRGDQGPGAGGLLHPPALGAVHHGVQGPPEPQGAASARRRNS
jgi:hypothetical protein